MSVIASNCRCTFSSKVQYRQQVLQPSIRSKQIKARSKMRGQVQTKASDELAKLFQSELEYELSNPPFEFPSTCPPPFKLDLQEGKTTVVLTAEQEGETIKISANSQDRMMQDKYYDEDMEQMEVAEDDDDDDNDQTATFDFTVTIRKNSKPDTEFRFDCSAVEGTLSIQNAVFSPIQDNKNTKDIDNLDYEGPLLLDLDDQLIDGLYGYLGVRGIDNAMIEYLDGLLQWKEEEEYKLWLKRGQQFLSS